MRGISAIRRFVDRRSGWNFGSICSVSRFHETQISTPINFSSPTISLKLPFANVYSTKIQFSCPSLQLQRTLSSSAGSSKTVLIKSEEQFNNSLKDVQDKSLPAIFYFTAKWCGPCKFISPILAEQSEKYPNVTTFKIDIDQEGLESLLSRLSIISVPTLHFFENGKKAAEIVGADVERLKDTMEELYGEDK
ncbi:hypothetical protein JCGZ_26541 [Jatropha curcas]|uniref:Thioredoxin domain-containing protein n=1 Tax=Jatropha curcas TaxID=180498 RepID=A0A067JX57_JATCU|nr:thioredoxin O1, mitochondrial [Jatropha curcas]KDP24585.1 hypothetical protein JCGZ_26541 [Jatropha curcas]